MNLYRKEEASVDEYYTIRESSEEHLEYIDGLIFMSPSPSTKHQRIVGRLYTKMALFFEGRSCEVLPGPYDIELKNDSTIETNVVIPDISVICDKSGFTEKRYVGVPSLIVEILSPSNQSHDLITKLNLYMDYGVNEYWIINPMLDMITIYSLNDEVAYIQHDANRNKGHVTSALFPRLKIDLEGLFVKNN
ncbi:Uma2 family endonuclease [Aquibacillus sp. 3ASR75-11]|uniref:Uma2 family endonuclease n=1 Tax=Terrihalobacillus insolitus TaxID=2950438 RepID=A0A9X4AN78_9BACI|nr:Uma2 family endonuclease [Terrihalobacillus insolitus]MDC3414535.1 Uma2 family endonuclease [Terrihalobacillus insolitus]MDC3426131.1 Uma2 family endonuclease [Terrihalobacillus insolitus]